MSFLILGADGQQGRIIYRYLSERNHKVHGVDLYGPYEQYDVSNVNRLHQTIQNKSPKVVINATTPFTNITVAKVCLDKGIHFIDLGSTFADTKTLFGLCGAFREKGITGITGCGSVPGIGNILVKYAVSKLEAVHTIEMGFVWNSNIKEFVSPFSISDIFYEYTGEVMYLENGEYKTTYPNKTIERREFGFIGSQKIFQVSHQESFTIPYYYRRKGLKNFKFYAGFPEHSDKVIRGLLGITDGYVVIGRRRYKAADLLMLLLKQKKIPKNYKEKENLWATIIGERKIRMECHVPPREDWREAGCNIDTGFPAAIIGEMILNGKIIKRGFYSMEAPELVPTMQFFKRLIQEKMRIYQDGKQLTI